MYKVYKETHSKYGNVIVINTEDIGEYELPFEAVNNAKSIKRLWATDGKVRFLINGQVLSINKLDSWANKEYKELSICSSCPNILNGKVVFTMPHCGIKLFCSQSCADKEYKFYLENLDEEEECDYL
jgi:predicted RNA-binding Zn-ribbon protein involved in translation (DUF1610 family)